jgi:cytochrome c biogenesis protein CcdA
MLFDRPYTRGRTPYGSFDLLTWSTTLKLRVVSNHSVLPIGHNSVLPCNRSVLLSLLLGSYFAIMSVPCCSGVFYS